MLSPIDFVVKKKGVLECPEFVRLLFFDDVFAESSRESRLVLAALSFAT
jgi:hypothetical protein